MGRVLTNNTSFAYSIESALGVAGTEWSLIEPNSIGSWGATITTVARDPISKNRQRRKGTTTDLDSALEFDHDLTLSAFMDFIEGFAFATAKNGDLDLKSTAVDGANDEFDLANAVDASQAGRLTFSASEYATLIFARGFDQSANNGLHQLDAAVADTDTAIGVTSTLTAEATAPANAQVELAGLRLLAASTDFTFAHSGNELTITEGGTIVGFDWTDYGLTVGQFVHIGSPDGSGGVQNALQDSAADDTFGYGRIKSIATQVLSLDKVDSTLEVASPTSDATVDLLFGKFIRNVAVDDSDYLERSFQFEAEFPNLGSAGGDEYEYSKGNYCDTVSFNLPLTEKATASFGFIGSDTETPVGSADRKTGADSAEQPVMTAAFNTSADIARLRITDVDETGLTTDFKSLTLTLGNNVGPEKVLGQLGAKYMNTGNFMVDVEAQLLFTNGDVVTRIRENTTVTMDFALKNDDGAIYVDIPSMDLGGGDREFPVNESVLINTTGMAFQDSVLDTSLGVSVFPVVPQ